MRKNNRAAITMHVDMSYMPRDPLWDEVWRRLLAPVPSTEPTDASTPVQAAKPSESHYSASGDESEEIHT